MDIVILPLKVGEPQVRPLLLSLQSTVSTIRVESTPPGEKIGWILVTCEHVSPEFMSESLLSWAHELRNLVTTLRRLRSHTRIYFNRSAILSHKNEVNNIGFRGGYRMVRGGSSSQRFDIPMRVTSAERGVQ